jgi:DNA-directed RNA polymerase subunit beta
MQRQAVPLLINSAPLVGTGIEGVVAKDSGVTVVARRDAEVVDVDAARIVLKHEPTETASEKAVTIYNLLKFIRAHCQKRPTGRGRGNHCGRARNRPR